MPDKAYESVSASQLGALYDLSSYGTRWELHQLFKHRAPLDLQSSRMTWGKRMQPLILDVVKEDKRLDVTPNPEDTYIRRGIVGCTRDADIVDPTRGPGALEVKCVFDYAVYGQKWEMGERVPPEYELQLQAQMGVGDGEKPYEWGLFAVWKCGEMEYFERTFNPEIWERIQGDVAAFLDDVKAGKAPNPIGTPAEWEWIRAAYPELERKTVQTDDIAVTEMARQYEYYASQESFAKKMRAAMKTKLWAIGDGADMLEFPFGNVRFKIAKNGAKSFKVWISDDAPVGQPEVLNTEDDGG